MYIFYVYVHQIPCYLRRPAAIVAQHKYLVLMQGLLNKSTGLMHSSFPYRLSYVALFPQINSSIVICLSTEHMPGTASMLTPSTRPKLVFWNF